MGLPLARYVWLSRLLGHGCMSLVHVRGLRRARVRLWRLVRLRWLVLLRPRLVRMCWGLSRLVGL